MEFCTQPLQNPEKICLIGSGNWGSAVARIIGKNVFRYDKFDKRVTMWVFEEEVQGRKLTEIINTEHENVKYLPGRKLPANVVAVPSLQQAVAGCTLLVFVLPHQFLNQKLFAEIKSGLSQSGVSMARVKAISLIKGIDFDTEGGRLVLISHLIRAGLSGGTAGISDIDANRPASGSGGIVGAGAPLPTSGTISCDVSVLMGANVAHEVADGQFCEATIGHSPTDIGLVNGLLWKDLFDIDYFRIALSPDMEAIELCGALKNIVALGAGFCDGLGYGTNTKAAIMRLGLLEIMQFCKTFYAGVQTATFFESCGIADLITTCFGGRNRKCAEAFVRSGQDWQQLEATMLGGQKLQGTTTCIEVYKILQRAGLLRSFPLFNIIYRIMTRDLPPNSLVEMYHHVPREEHCVVVLNSGCGGFTGFGGLGATGFSAAGSANGPDVDTEQRHQLPQQSMHAKQLPGDGGMMAGPGSVQLRP